MEGGEQSLCYGLLPIHLIKGDGCRSNDHKFCKKRKLMNKVYARTLREFKIHD